MNTKSLPTRSFTTNRGTSVTVWTERPVEKLGFWTGLGRPVRTFVVNNDTGWTADLKSTTRPEEVANDLFW